LVDLFARVIIAARFPIIVGWVAAAAVMAFALPTLREAQTGALGQLVPADSRALEAEKLSATSFRFPLASRTAVVERDAGGLGPERVATTVLRITDVNEHRLRGVRAAGAYGIANSLPGLAFVRERGTTAVSSLLFGLDVNQNARVAAARRYAAALDAPARSYVGITGAILPAARCRAPCARVRSAPASPPRRAGRAPR